MAARFVRAGGTPGAEGRPQDADPGNVLIVPAGPGGAVESAPSPDDPVARVREELAGIDFTLEEVVERARTNRGWWNSLEQRGLAYLIFRPKPTPRSTSDDDTEVVRWAPPPVPAEYDPDGLRAALAEMDHTLDEALRYAHTDALVWDQLREYGYPGELPPRPPQVVGGERFLWYITNVTLFGITLPRLDIQGRLAVPPDRFMPRPIQTQKAHERGLWRAAMARAIKQTTYEPFSVNTLNKALRSALSLDFHYIEPTADSLLPVAEKLMLAVAGLAERVANSNTEAKLIGAPLRSAADISQDDGEAGGEPEPQWLVTGILLPGQPAIVGGPKKTLKSSVLADLSVSVASGTPFLGRFAVPEPGPVILLSGEGGEENLARLVRRVVRARGLPCIPDDLHLGTTLPQLADPDMPDRLRKLLELRRPRLLVVDPLYLALEAGSGKRRGADPTSLYSVGQRLYPIGQVCGEMGCSLVIAHHFTKGTPPGHLPDLDDLAYAGVAEYARAWILTNRKTAYLFNGKHDLLMTVGQSAGGSAAYRVQVDEKVPEPGKLATGWDVTVEPYEPRQKPAAVTVGPEATPKAPKPAQRVLAAFKDYLTANGGNTAPYDLIRKKAGMNGHTMSKAVTKLEGTVRVELVPNSKGRLLRLLP